MNPVLSLRIDGGPIAPAQFAVPGMSLSAARTGMKRHSFVFVIGTVRLVEFLTPAYEAWVEGSKRDDAICGGPQDDLAIAGYPPFSCLVENPDLLQLVLGYLQTDFLEKLTWDGVTEIEYWLDEVTGCESDKQRVVLTGICYSKK